MAGENLCRTIRIEPSARSATDSIGLKVLASSVGAGNSDNAPTDIGDVFNVAAMTKSQRFKLPQPTIFGGEGFLLRQCGYGILAQTELIHARHGGSIFAFYSP